MEKYMNVNIDTTGIHDLSNEKMDANELRRMTSEECVLAKIGQVEYEQVIAKQVRNPD